MGLGTGCFSFDTCIYWLSISSTDHHDIGGPFRLLDDTTRFMKNPRTNATKMASIVGLQAVNLFSSQHTRGCLCLKNRNLFGYCLFFPNV